LVSKAKENRGIESQLAEKKNSQEPTIKFSEKNKKDKRQ
jgi:hypothetical protein